MKLFMFLAVPVCEDEKNSFDLGVTNGDRERWKIKVLWNVCVSANISNAILSRIPRWNVLKQVQTMCVTRWFQVCRTNKAFNFDRIMCRIVHKYFFIRAVSRLLSFDSIDRVSTFWLFAVSFTSNDLNRFVVFKHVFAFQFNSKEILFSTDVTVRSFDVNFSIHCTTLLFPISGVDFRVDFYFFALCHSAVKGFSKQKKRKGNKFRTVWVRNFTFSAVNFELRAWVLQWRNISTAFLLFKGKENYGFDRRLVMKMSLKQPMQTLKRQCSVEKEEKQRGNIYDVTRSDWSTPVAGDFGVQVNYSNAFAPHSILTSLSKHYQKSFFRFGSENIDASLLFQNQLKLTILSARNHR